MDHIHIIFVSKPAVQLSKFINSLKSTSARLIFRDHVVEDLRIRNMVKNHNLAKSISDAGWGEFISMLSYKAESAGRTVEKVLPHGTTQECSRCGNTVKKNLSVRVHICMHCGLVLDRDHNAAINILQKSKASFCAAGMAVICLGS